ncbi:MAG TPA: hypothetical protein VMT47_10220 [Polyangia bacterium]|nr:hypothetical protein [Polyangia bacterium]
MRPLRYSINVTLDGCCDHREGIADEELHRHAIENLKRNDALLLGRVTYEMMEAAWRAPAETGVRPDWMEDWGLPFARTIDAAKKYVVSRTLVFWPIAISASSTYPQLVPLVLAVGMSDVRAHRNLYHPYCGASGRLLCALELGAVVSLYGDAVVCFGALPCDGGRDFCGFVSG